MARTGCLGLLLLGACTDGGDGGPLVAGGGDGLGGGAGAATGSASVAFGGAGGAATGSGAGAATGGAATGPWSMGYYASWQSADLPVAEIEWSGLTHLAVAFYTPRSDGPLALMGGDPTLADELVAAAHEHGVRAVASIGGADSAADFRAATATGAMDAFVAALVALLDAPGYDGLDLDWEPLETADEPAAIAVAEAVRAARPDVLLTIPVGAINPNLAYDVSGYAAIAGAYDQVNLMSYGLAGAWEGWNSWHSSALYQTNPATPLSVDSSVAAYLAAGVPASKLGIGIGFYGLCYSPPVTGPDQPLGGATILASDGTMSFANIMERYFDPAARRWDDLARVPYLTFDEPRGPEGCTYVSYDDDESIAAKADYVRERGLGGLIEWEINEGHLASAPAGERSPLLLALRDQLLR